MLSMLGTAILNAAVASALLPVAIAVTVFLTLVRNAERCDIFSSRCLRDCRTRFFACLVLAKGVTPIKMFEKIAGNDAVL